MSRPQRRAGHNLPGQFMATRVRVLAAELSTPQRLTRGRVYADTGAVIDLAVVPGCATAVVQGSRAHPYQVELEVHPGDGPPLRRDLTIGCSCPDAAGASSDACKHAVAALIVLADEIAVAPATLGRWRAASGADPPAASAPAPGATQDREPTQGRRSLAALLSCPTGSTMPEIPEIDAGPPHHLSDPDLANAIAAARDVIAGHRADIATTDARNEP